MAKKRTAKRGAAEKVRKLTDVELEVLHPGSLRALGSRLSQPDAVTGACRWPNPAGGPDFCAEGVDAQFCQNRQGGTFSPGGNC
jgi:hypothetical protein